MLGTAYSMSSSQQGDDATALEAQEEGKVGGGSVLASAGSCWATYSIPSSPQGDVATALEAQKEGKVGGGSALASAGSCWALLTACHQASRETLQQHWRRKKR
jgi:hypothetical protein